MLLNMQITMPSQDPMAVQEFSLAPRNMRKWLKALPYIDHGVAAQQFYNGLKRINRQAHTAKQRLIATEMMQPVAREFLKQQRKYLIAQLFPLSKKATETFKLQQNILSELAVAYKIVIQETANRDIQLSSKKIVMCIHRAMRYMLEQYVTLAQVYSEPPQVYWQDYCQLYKMAEHLNLNHLLVKYETHYESSKSTIDCLFKQACLLSLANLSSFGHGEAEKITTFLASMNHLTELSDVKHLQENDDVYFINLVLNKPPRLATVDELPISSENRFLDPANLINELHKIATSEGDKQTEAILSRSTLNKQLAKRLLNKLTNKVQRAAKRNTASKEKLNVVLGLRDAIDTLLCHDANKDKNKEAAELTATNLDLLPIKPHQTTSSYYAYSNLNQNTNTDPVANAWENAMRGNVITKSYAPSTPNTAKKSNEAINLKPVIQSWEISNASNGGYCLQSKNTSDYQSQVGDLVLLRLEASPKDNWRLGIVRWMQSLSERGVKIGIETLKGSASPVEVIDTHFSLNKFKGLEHILQLAEETPYGESLTLIAPPNCINTGESLDIQLNGNNQTIVFQHIIERTISFVRFSFSIQPSTN